MKKRSRRAFELSVRYSPRINRRFVRMVERIAERNHMPESDVLRYAFEAGLVTAGRTVERRESDTRALLDSMVTVRTTQWMSAKMNALWRAHPNEIQADVLRALLERMLPIARDKGMAHVMRLRERNL